MAIKEIKEDIKNIFENIKFVFSESKEKIKNLEENNMDLAIEYFEYGIVDECRNRLKIMLRLWPKNNEVKYLMGLVCILYRDNDNALKYLSEVKEEKQEFAEKLINIINFNKAEKIIDAYKEKQDLSNIESVIGNVKI